MKIQIDGISGKESRISFKKGLIKAVDGVGNVYLTPSDTVVYQYREPYLMNDDDLAKKSRIKKIVYDYIEQYRMNQFNA